MRKQLITRLFLITDFLAAISAWVLFYFYRVVFIEETDIVFKGSFFLSIFLVPAFWLFLYILQGTYINAVRTHRMKVLKMTFYGTTLGVIIVFFATLLNDTVIDYTEFYKLFGIYWLLHFFLALVPRLLITTIHVKRIHKGKFGFKTIILGGNEKASKFLAELNEKNQNSGHKIIGFVQINGSDSKVSNKLQLLGSIENIQKIIEEQQVQEVIIALETSEHERLKSLISKLAATDVRISLIPDTYDILSGFVQMSSIFGALLLKVNTGSIPDWQIASKRTLDIAISLFAIIMLIPVYLVVGTLVKITSKGSALFTQERIGLNGKPFKIIKFRTMQINAEETGPQLSSSKDKRITTIGRFLRKTRLDEFPQFFNVLIGDMSLVGPRPERKFFIDQIVKKDPQYLYLHKVRPGITSWGQVKFGYAENVEQMLQRMKYDLLYIRNMSLALDFRIMFYTVLIIFKGQGK